MTGQEYILEQLGGQKFVEATGASIVDHENYVSFLVGTFPKNYCRVEIVPDVFGTYGVISERIRRNCKIGEWEHKRVPAAKLCELVLGFLKEELWVPYEE